MERDDRGSRSAASGGTLRVMRLHNLKADPNVEVQWYADKLKARAIILPEPERSQVWGRVVAAMPGFADYQKKTTRVIPIVQLVRA